jgi:hypothetical protein
MGGDPAARAPLFQSAVVIDTASRLLILRTSSRVFLFDKKRLVSNMIEPYCRAITTV